jgi:exodeoxyribonuclease VII large subunit
VPRIFRVSELVAGVRQLLEERVGRLWVVGEVSNLRAPGSGHLYFTLKDEAAQLRAALFRSVARRLPFEPEDGLEVLVFGELSVFEARGDLQLLVRHLEPRGQGALQLAFEQLRARLEAEGLFDPALKRSLPPHPRRVGVVTSPTGAAIQDVIRVARQRSPSTPILLAPARVQGAGAEEELAEALAALAGWPGVDVILLVRGGGSLEDLWPFNTERLARALRACPVPVVSGVGHEVDVTIADLVADARAPTPSAAAALALPDRESLISRLSRDLRSLVSAAARRLERADARVVAARERLRLASPMARLAAQGARLEAAIRGLRRATDLRVERADARLAAAAARLDALSPLAVLGRGYALVRRADDGTILRRAADASPGDALDVRLSEGSLAAVVTGREGGSS